MLALLRLGYIYDAQLEVSIWFQCEHFITTRLIHFIISLVVLIFKNDVGSTETLRTYTDDLKISQMGGKMIFM